MQTDLTLLSKFLQETNIPEDKENIGFLELIKKPMNETINSQIYAHFLGCEIPEIRNAFMEGLMTILENRVDKKIVIAEPFIHTEVYTASKKRVDIVIEDFHSQSAIIIENKIKHEVNNPFIEYWEHYNKFSESNRIGVLLTIKPEVVPDEVKTFFINITHKEWITEVKEKLVNSILPKNYEVYINDFISTIENISKNYKMNDSAKFYFENSEQILKAQATIFEAQTFMNNQLEIVAQELGLKAYGNSMDWRNFWDENNHLDTYLTVLIRDIMNGILRFSIIIELNRLDKTREEEIKNKFNNHPQFISKKRGESKGSYVHFLCAHYELSVDDLKDFGQFVVGKVREDFGDLFVQIIESIYPDKDISAWKENLQVVQKDYITE